jgi:hypothetical protein
MAEYIKYRVTAAKVGVTMALLGLISGLVERAAAKPSHGDAKKAAAVDYLKFDTHYLKLDGLSTAERNVFLKLEYKLNQVLVGLDHKLNQVLVGLDHKLSSSFYDKHKVDQTFLKIRDAGAEYLKIDAASQTYLNITDAASKYLKIDGVAADSHKLGGMTSDQFVQGRGGVVSGEATVAGDGSVRPVLQSPDGKFVVTISGNADQAFVNINNGSGALLPAVQQADGGIPKTADLAPGNNIISLIGFSAPHQLHLQVFGNDRLHEAMTLTLSTEPSSTQGLTQVVAQLLIGLL